MSLNKFNEPEKVLMNNLNSLLRWNIFSHLCLGELYHGHRKSGPNEIRFTIRVYPFVDYQLRTQERSVQAIQKLVNSSAPDQNIALNCNKQVKSKKKKKISSCGHLGKN